MLREKLPNFEEYFHLPEYINLVALLEKGIATHHSKMLPVFREIVEIFFARGYIKLLFATESVAIGLNLPVKTCIFTDIHKHDGTNLRLLYAHEYTQSAGRAGRLGLDTVGHVIHMNNLFRNVDSVSYKTMMNGKPQTLTSKFKISHNLLLNLIDIGDNKLVDFAKRSMVTGDLDQQLQQLYYRITALNGELDNMKTCAAANLRTPSEVIQQFIDLQKALSTAVNKKRKDIERQLTQLRDNYKYIEPDKITFQKRSVKENEINELQRQFDGVNSYIKSGVASVLNLLKDESYIEGATNPDNGEYDESSLKLTMKGKFASQLREVHCLAFAKLLEDKSMEHLTSKQLVSLFSIFTNINVQEECKSICPGSRDEEIQQAVRLLTVLYNDYQNKEFKYGVNTGFDYNIHYDLLNYVEEWCDCENVESCKAVLQKLGSEKEIFLGEFVKALLKINNISCEMEKIAEMTGNIAFLSKLKEIPNMTLKYVVTNQSLYV
jgi:superfamily II RNA helicase